MQGAVDDYPDNFISVLRAPECQTVCRIKASRCTAFSFRSECGGLFVGSHFNPFVMKVERSNPCLNAHGYSC